MVSALLWSPLTTIGLLPFALYISWHQLRKIVWLNMSVIVTIVTALLLGCVISSFLIMDIGDIPYKTASTILNSFSLFYFVYLCFIATEFLILLGLLLRVRANLLGALAGLTLAILPFYSFGPGNDLVMRGGIAALTVICLFSIDILLKSDWILSLQVPILLVLTIGAITPLHELVRAVILPRWSPSLDKNLIQVSSGGLPAHYIGLLDNDFVANILKPPIFLRNKGVK